MKDETHKVKSWEEIQAEQIYKSSGKGMGLKPGEGGPVKIPGRLPEDTLREPPPKEQLESISTPVPSVDEIELLPLAGVQTMSCLLKMPEPDFTDEVALGVIVDDGIEAFIKKKIEQALVPEDVLEWRNIRTEWRHRVHALSIMQRQIKSVMEKEKG